MLIDYRVRQREYLLQISRALTAQLNLDELLQLVLEAFRFGDRRLFEAHPELDQSPIWVHFHATQRRYDQIQPWGTLADYKLLSAAHREA